MLSLCCIELIRPLVTVEDSILHSTLRCRLWCGLDTQCPTRHSFLSACGVNFLSLSFLHRSTNQCTSSWTCRLCCWLRWCRCFLCLWRFNPRSRPVDDEASFFSLVPAIISFFHQHSLPPNDVVSSFSFSCYDSSRCFGSISLLLHCSCSCYCRCRYSYLLVLMTLVALPWHARRLLVRVAELSWEFSSQCTLLLVTTIRDDSVSSLQLQDTNGESSSHQDDGCIVTNKHKLDSHLIISTRTPKNTIFSQQKGMNPVPNKKGCH